MFADVGLLALRLALGAVFLAHGAQKGFGAFGGPGFEGATGFIGSLGFRPARLWAGLAVGGELAAGFLFLLGLLTPVASLLALATMAVAIAKVHGPKGFFIQNGGYEYNLVLIVAALAVAVMGPGGLSLYTVTPCRVLDSTMCWGSRGSGDSVVDSPRRLPGQGVWTGSSQSSSLRSRVTPASNSSLISPRGSSSVSWRSRSPSRSRLRAGSAPSGGCSPPSSPDF